MIVLLLIMCELKTNRKMKIEYVLTGRNKSLSMFHSLTKDSFEKKIKNDESISLNDGIICSDKEMIHIINQSSMVYLHENGSFKKLTEKSFSNKSNLEKLPVLINFN